MDYSEKLAA